MRILVLILQWLTGSATPDRTLAARSGRTNFLTYPRNYLKVQMEVTIMQCGESHHCAYFGMGDSRTVSQRQYASQVGN
jgi:hypothetical protein